jgi:hypothetical protein
MLGGEEKNSPALAMSAAATLPVGCASRSASSEKASNILKVDGPKRIPNQTVEAGSSYAIARATRRKFSKSFSYPGFASKRTNNATFIIMSVRIVQPSQEMLP